MQEDKSRRCGVVKREETGLNRPTCAFPRHTNKHWSRGWPSPSTDTVAVDLKPRAVEWLWSGRVPLGMITMFAGDPKLGKSYVTLAMAAALSRGLPLPWGDQPDRPGSTILMSAEDDPARTIVPRLVAGGAERTKDPHPRIGHPRQRQRRRYPSLRADIDAITAAAAVGRLPLDRDRPGFGLSQGG